MLNQKDNDFDDLFRRASDKYPLRTDSADWDRMAAALDNPPPDLPDTGLDMDRRRRRRFLWLFLLLPLGGAGYYAFHQGAGHGHSVASTSSAQAQPSKGAAGGVGADGAGTRGVDADGAGPGGVGTDGAGTGGVDAGKGGTATGDAGKAGAGTGGAGSGATGGVGAGRAGEGTGAGRVGSGGVGTGRAGGAEAARTGSSSAETAGVNGGVKTAGAGSGSAGAVGNDAGTGSGTTGKRRPGAETSVSGKGYKGYKGSDNSEYTVIGKRRRKGSAAGGDDFADAAAGAGDKDAGHVNNNNAGLGNAGLGNAGLGAAGLGNKDASRVANYPVNRAGISRDYNLTVNVEAPVVHKDSSKTKPKASSKQKSSFLYAGLLAAPDLSTVRFQTTKGMGTTFSLLLGYQFNKRWAIESGVSVDRKRYYTSGEYFKGAAQNYNGWTLQNVDGTCYMWEIPVNVRYNFSQSEKTKWFATAGLSTYLMTRENYTFQYLGLPQTMYKDWRNPSHYWFSIINLSAGYEYRLGRVGNLRIEPYLRVPLSGLGSGKLNILSTGLNIGITRRLW